MQTEHLTFQSRTGNSLAASLDLAVGVTRAISLFAHCFTCGKDLRAARRLTEGLAQRGIATLRFDFTGLGSSEGDFSHTNFSSNIDDLVSAADWLRQNYGPPSLMIGHSLGGAAAIAAAPRIPEIVAVATIGAPCDPSHVTNLFGEDADVVAAEGIAEVSIGGRPFTVRQQFLDDIKQNALQASLDTMDAALLIMHSPTDAIVSARNGETLFELAKQPKSFVALNGADHLLSQAADATYAAETLAAWADKYLAKSVTTSEDVLFPATEGEVTVVERGTGRYAQVVRVGQRHVLLADEPEPVGGGGTGAAPYDLLLGALGACSNMAVRHHADRKGWNLDGVVSTLRHQRTHFQDLNHGPSGLLTIEQLLVLQGELSESQRSELLQAAKSCPVATTLKANLAVSTVLDQAR